MSIIYAGYPDGITDNTKTLNIAISEASGRDSLVIKKGTYLTGPLTIPTDSHIIIEKDAKIVFTDCFDVYNPVFTKWEGVDCWAMHPCIWVNCAENIVIEGSGTIDGRGEKWWSHIMQWKNCGRPFGPVAECEKRIAALNPSYKDQPDGGGGRSCQFLRPPLFQIYKSSNVTVKGINFKSSPFWNIHTVYSDNLVFDSVTVTDPWDSPNTDGIDIESCSNVIIRNCIVDVGDDGIALKSGSVPDLSCRGKSTENVIVEDCTVKNAHGGFTIGSETAGGFSDIMVRRCLFTGTDRGIRIKTRRGRGGHIHGINISDIEINDTICPITISEFYQCGVSEDSVYSLEKAVVSESTPVIEDIRISNVKAKGCRAGAGQIIGLPEMPVRNVSVKNCDISVTDKIYDNLEMEMTRGIPDTGYRGFRICFAENIVFEDNTVNVDPPFANHF